MDGPTPTSLTPGANDDGQLEVEKPSRVFSNAAFGGAIRSVKLVLAVSATAVWLGQSFLWGGPYLGCGLTVAVSMVAVARLLVKDYTSHGSFVHR